MWDITYLKTRVHGMFFYLYLFMDLFDRSIVGFEVYEQESAHLAAKLVERISLDPFHKGGFRYKIRFWHKTILPSDNGSPMKGATMLATLYRLGITPSNSRPRTSNTRR